MKKLERDFTLQVHITEKCQYNCKHCYLGNKSNQEMPFDYFQMLVLQYLTLIGSIEEASETEITPVIHITGGDPLLHSQIKDILSFCNEKNIKIGLMGNPDTINKKNIKLLEKHNVKSFQLSIDGDEKYHDSVRKKGSFKRTIQAIKLLKTSNIKVLTMFNVCNDNITQIFNSYALMNSLKVDTFSFARIVNIGNADTMSKEFNTAYYLNEMKCLLKVEAVGTTQIKRKDPLWSLVDPQPKSKYIIGGCQAGITLINVDVNGDVYPCRRLPVKIGNFKERSLTYIYQHDKILWNLREKSKCNKCKLCNQCRGCPGVAYAKTGDYLSIDPDCPRSKK